jgi:prolyl oligopeptidase
VDFSAYEAVREMATSRDGTKVPVNIVRRRGLELTGENPCVVSGYGGYGVNIEPHFVPQDLVLLEQGFVLATANIRGGGEFGEAWHLAGNLESKQNVFDDFAAACTHMVQRKYTSPKKLAIEGGSNGGLLMGAAMTQHPDLAACVVSHVGIYDMLRVELSPNGAFNIPEFGTVKNERQFRAMYAYSPLHNVKDGTAYPATLFLTGANDPRVDPMQSRKMIARLQAAIAGVNDAGPILLRTSGDTGHGIGTPLDERIAQAADVDAFVMKALGMAWRDRARR